jgi:TATA-binding protein-associated factor
METDQILDLFNLNEPDGASAPPLPNAGDQQATEDDAVDATGEVRKDGKRGFLDELGELWDEKQYEEEYNLDSFLATMRG